MSRTRIVVAIGSAAVLVVAGLAAFGVYSLAVKRSSGLAWGTKLSVEGRLANEYSLYVLLCPNEHVTELHLSVSDRDFTKIGRTAWSITANRPNTISTFAPGVTPEGFVARVPLDSAALRSSPSLIFVVRTDGPHGQFLIDFKPSQLKIDRFYIRGPSLLGSKVYVSDRQLQSVRQRMCNEQGHDAGG